MDAVLLLCIIREIAGSRELGSFQRREGSTNLRVSSEGAEEDKAATATAAAAALLLKGNISPPAAGFGLGSGFALAISLLSEEGLGPAGWAQRTHRRAASPLRCACDARGSLLLVFQRTHGGCSCSYRNDNNQDRVQTFFVVTSVPARRLCAWQR